MSAHKFSGLRCLATALCAVVVVLLSAWSVYAVDLTDLDGGHHFKIKGTESWSIDSNPLRLASGSDTLMGSETSPELILGDVTPTHKVYLDTLVNYNLYDDSRFNTTNFHETLGLFKMNQRWVAGVEGRFDYDTTRTNEITSFGISIPSVRHTGLLVAPQVSFNPTAIDKMMLNGSMSQSTYDNSAFVDYKAFSLSPSYAHNFDPNNAGLIIMNFQRYQADDANKSRTDSVGPSLGWTSIINNRLDTKFSAGMEKTKQSSLLDISKSSQLNYVFSASANFKGQGDVASITASRSQRPFGNGSSLLLTSLDIGGAHSVNEKLTFNAGSNYSYTNSSSSSGVNLDKQLKISGGVSYRLLRSLDFTTNYQYIDQKLTGSSGSIKEQILLIGIGYHPDFSPI